MTTVSSPNCEARPDGSVIDMLVLHYTGMESGEAALERLCDPAAKVSAHYLIEEDGTVHTLVPEELRAWHAGLSFWRGQKDINSRSIGIELVNPGHEFGYRAFPESQMQSLQTLVAAILTRHPIPSRNIVGHSDVAPDRKQDPGELFDWAGLAAAGIGLWPDPDVVPVKGRTNDLLRQWGYQIIDIRSEQQALAAFQRHFRPARIDGMADIETTLLLGKLLAMVDQQQ